MPSWTDFANAAPELATAVRGHLDAHPFKLLATVRRDGSPRISGIEVELAPDGSLRAGSMPASRKVADLDRDNRFSLHSAPAPRDAWSGDAKLSGTAHPVDGPQPEARYFRLDLDEVATVGVSPDGLAVTVWTPAGGVRRTVR